MIRAAPIRFMAASALACAAASCWLPANAATYRIDDTGTVVGQPVTPMRWRQLVPGRAGDNTVEGQLPVTVRLNLASWVGQRARIYMALAPTDGQQLVASWRTQGRLLPGQLRGGDRAVVFEGVVRDPFLTETLLLELTANGVLLERPQQLQFFFEIEVGA